MYRIRLFNQIALRGLERFPRDRYEVGHDIPLPDGILLRSHRLRPEEVDGNLRAVARAGAGVNNVPVDFCTERGVVVFNTPGANANSVKELVLAALLVSSRDLVGGMAFVASLADVREPGRLDALVEAEKKKFRGRELSGKTLGVVGLGAIGSLVARAALDLGMHVLGHDPAISVEAAWAFAKRGQAHGEPAEPRCPIRLRDVACAAAAGDGGALESRELPVLPPGQRAAELRARAYR